MPKIGDPKSVLIAEPNLLIPHAFPVGNVEIDWQHPAARHLLCYVIPRNGRMMDIAYGKTSAKWASGNLGDRFFTDYSDAVTFDGMGVLTDGNNECAISSGTVKRPDQFTVLIQYKHDNSPLSWRYYMYSGHFEQFSVYSDPNYNEWRVCGNAILGNKDLSDGRWWSFAARADGTTATVDFMDGVSLSNSSTYTAHTADYLAIGGRDDSTGRNAGGYTRLCAIFNTMLSDSITKDLLRDPFQLLRVV